MFLQFLICVLNPVATCIHGGQGDGHRSGPPHGVEYYIFRNGLRVAGVSVAWRLWRGQTGGGHREPVCRDPDRARASVIPKINPVMQSCDRGKECNTFENNALAAILSFGLMQKC